MSQISERRVLHGIGRLQLAIIVLAAITALIHLQRALGMGAGMLFGMAGAAPGGLPAGGPPGGGPPAGGPPGDGPGGGFGIMQMLPLPLPVLFLFNGIGYLVLVTALYLPALQRFQSIIRWVLIAFTAVTIVMYFLVVGLMPNPIGIVDKIVEITLIGLLLVEGWQVARQPAIVAEPA